MMRSSITRLLIQGKSPIVLVSYHEIKFCPPLIFVISYGCKVKIKYVPFVFTQIDIQCCSKRIVYIYNLPLKNSLSVACRGYEEKT